MLKKIYYLCKSNQMNKHSTVLKYISIKNTHYRSNMKKKFFLLATVLGLGSASIINAQETSSSRSLIKDDADYGVLNETYNDYDLSWKKNKFKDNWIITIGGGAQMLFGEDDHKGDFIDRVTFAPKLTIGKYFGPTWGFRLNFTGGSLHGYNDGMAGIYRKWNHGDKHYLGKGYVGTPGYPAGEPNTNMLTWDPQWNYIGASLENGQIRLDPVYNAYVWVPGEKGDLYFQRVRYVQANIDFMFDLFNALNGYNPKRFFEVTPFAGLGLYNALSYRGNDNYLAAGLQAGFMLKFRLTERLGVNAEFGGSLVPDDFDGQSGDHTSMNGIAQATANISYKIGKTDWDVVEPMDYQAISSMQDEINRLKEELAKKPIVETVVMPAPPIQEVKKDENQTKFLPDPVFFTLNSAKIDNNQWGAIDKAAEYLNKYPDARVVLTGYADKETGSATYNMKLSEKRAKTVAEVLIQRYGVNPLRISVNWSGSQIQPFKIQDWNRVVIFVIE